MGHLVGERAAHGRATSGHLFFQHLDQVREEVGTRVEERVKGRAGDGIADHLLGGKRLRAGTVLLMHSTLSDDGGGRDLALDLAAAVEVAHGISLMIDDLVDGDATRRGRPSVPACRSISRTVLEAVGLLSTPYALVGPHGPRFIERLSAVHEAMAQGAISELEAPRNRPAKAAYGHLVDMKTGRLFELSAQFGALAAGCCDSKAALAGAYGRELGAVHQISDDIADLRGALSEGLEPRGSEAWLFARMVRDNDDRDRAMERGALTEEAESKVQRELASRIRGAEKAARTMVSAVGRCGRRKGAAAYLPVLLSAPTEIAGSMLRPPTENGPPQGSGDRS